MVNFSKETYSVHKCDLKLEFVLNLNKPTCTSVCVHIVSDGE